MKKAVTYYGESVLAPYRYSTEWPGWAQRSFREAVMYYLKEKEPVLGLLYLEGLLNKFIEENKCQIEEHVADSVKVFRRLKLIRNRFAHPDEGSEHLIVRRNLLIPLCLQIVHVVMNNLYPARRPGDSSKTLVAKVQIARSAMSSTTSDRFEKEEFYRNVNEYNKDIVKSFLGAIPTRRAILDLPVDELARLLENRVVAPAIIHDGDGASFEVALGAVSKGVCEYESCPEGWMCRARNTAEDPWRDDKWSYERFADSAGRNT